MIITGIVLDDQVTKGVGMKPGTMPRVEPVGDDVLGSQIQSLLITALTDSGQGRRFELVRGRATGSTWCRQVVAIPFARGRGLFDWEARTPCLEGCISGLIRVLSDIGHTP